MAQDTGVRRKVDRLAGRGGALPPGGETSQEVASVSGTTREYERDAQGCIGDTMDLDYMEDSPEEAEIIEAVSDKEEEQTEVRGANVPCHSMLQGKEKHL
ncbi:hypothetical protein NDU88_000510 [Pleurodeles waltl]|uniref:Uncharacterized protein n=1 Tax=Pleurodeles waltl TaxID=8319 RepID=A0AAV7TF89_PLEWA|nr:hypothetical protein NDU88_000510 [Pleurodeles waltl]